MDKILHIMVLLVMYNIQVNAQAQKSEIKVFPQNTEQFSRTKIINGLVSSGVKILDVKTNFKSESHVMGFFIDSTKYMGIEQGMILSTGTVDDVTKENTQGNTSSDVDEDHSGGDVDLSNEIKGLETFDARIITIKFTPTADTIYYRYIFASEEYDEYVCSKFNDVFAFYLFQKGEKKKNIALVPNQNLPVSINTVNNGNPSSTDCEKTNSYLYLKNNGNQNLLYDGFTKILDIREKVTPGEEYYLKIAIADASDKRYDSAVLLESRSFFSYFQSFEIQFDKNSSISNDKSKFKKTVELLKKHPNSKVQLIGHCDQSGSIEYNFELSIKRVTEVKKYLKSKGISEDRIIESYKGETMPRYEEENKNRRVEVFVIGK